MSAPTSQPCPAESTSVTTDILGRHDQVMAPNYAPMPIVPERGEGVWLWDRQGNQYLDFSSGIAVSSLGHAHPALREALAYQAERFWHVSNLMTNEPAVELADRLCQHTFAERVFFCNSGAEANEAALKLARRYAVDHHGAQKDEIISFYNGFHGRTFFTVCVGGQEKYSDGFGPKPGGITHLPFNDIAALQAAVSDKTCAIMLEPIQGEGGVNPADEAFLQTARSLCDEYDALLIFDEIQTGVGRSGTLFAYQGMNVTPDILTSAKGLGGGFPVAAMLATTHVAESLAVGTHGSTFGGNPMACAVANKVLEIIVDTGLMQTVGDKSAQLITGLNNLSVEHGVFSEVRGKGLLIGCELSEAWQGRAMDVLNACLAQGLLVLVAGPNVLRLAPPLIASSAEIEDGLERLSTALKTLT